MNNRTVNSEASPTGTTRDGRDVGANPLGRS